MVICLEDLLIFGLASWALIWLGRSVRADLAGGRNRSTIAALVSATRTCLIAIAVGCAMVVLWLERRRESRSVADKRTTRVPRQIIAPAVQPGLTQEELREVRARDLERARSRQAVVRFEPSNGQADSYAANKALEDAEKARDVELQRQLDRVLPASMIGDKVHSVPGSRWVTIASSANLEATGEKRQPGSVPAKVSHGGVVSEHEGRN